MVVVIIGILAMTVIPKYQHSKGNAYVAAMKSDLRNLANAEEAYFYDNSIYTSDATTLNYQQSDLTIINVQTADAMGWSATISHGRTDVVCALFMGHASPIAPATAEGVPKCQ